MMSQVMVAVLVTSALEHTPVTAWPGSTVVLGDSVVQVESGALSTQFSRFATWKPAGRPSSAAVGTLAVTL